MNKILFILDILHFFVNYYLYNIDNIIDNIILNYLKYYN